MKPVTKDWLADVMSTPPASTTPPTITVSRRVHVTCVEESSGNQLKSFKLDVEVPQTVATLAAVQELNKKLWPTVKNCIPKRLLNGQYVRTRYNISVYHSNRTEQFIRILNVNTIVYKIRKFEFKVYPSITDEYGKIIFINNLVMS